MHHYFDDFRIRGFAFEKGSAFECFELTAGLLGWTFDPEKDCKPAKSITLLGNTEDWSLCGSDDLFVVAPTADRISDLQKALDTILESKRLPKALALSLRGKLLNLSRVCGANRVGLHSARLGILPMD